MFDRLKKQGFEVLALHHAEAIIQHDLKAAISELESVLVDVRVPVTELVRGGGGEGALTQRLRRALAEERGWHKHIFEVKKIVDGEERESTTHEVDHVRMFDRGKIALEIEWNNKDPFFDRDLENFKRLHADGAISVGCIITRGASLHEAMAEMIEAFARKHAVRTVDDLAAYYTPTPRQKQIILKNADREKSFARGWAQAFVADKFGEATTHWRKLEERVQRGVGNPCPLLLIGLPKGIVQI